MGLDPFPSPPPPPPPDHSLKSSKGHGKTVEQNTKLMITSSTSSHFLPIFRKLVFTYGKVLYEQSTFTTWYVVTVPVCSVCFVCFLVFTNVQTYIPFIDFSHAKFSLQNEYYSNKRILKPFKKKASIMIPSHRKCWDCRRPRRVCSLTTNHLKGSAEPFLQ